MASAATATPTGVPKTSSSNGRPENHRSAPIETEYVAASKSHKLPHALPYNLFDGDIYEIAKGDPGFWVKKYGAAKSLQADQHKNFFEIQEIALKQQSQYGFGFEVIEDNFYTEGEYKGKEEYMKKEGSEQVYKLRGKINQQSDELKAINDEIAEKNKTAGRVADFGFLRVFPLWRPRLNNEASMTAIETSYGLQSHIAIHLYQAYCLQQYRDDYYNAVDAKKVEYDLKQENMIQEALEKLNQKVREIADVHLKPLMAGKLPGAKQNFHLFLVPQQGDQRSDLDNQFWEQEEDEEFNDEPSKDGMMYSDPDDPVYIGERGDLPGGQSERQPLPHEINTLRERIGGNNGLLQTYVMSIVNGNKDENAGKQLDDWGKEVDAYCDGAKIHRKTYALTWVYINAFAEMVQQALKGYDAILADTSNKKAQEDYTLLRQRGAYFIQQQQMPESFLDAFIPSEAELVAAIQSGLQEKEKEKARKSQQDNKNVHASVPPEGNIEAQCISTNTAPGIVADEVNGKVVYKRIVGCRKAGRDGNQILLKSQGTNLEFPGRFIFELVAARQFGDALEEYRSTGGREHHTETSTFLKGKFWSKCMIGGVASIRRNPDGDYANEAATQILCKWPDSNFVWIWRTVLAERYGKAQIKPKISQYRIEAGQEHPKAPTKKRVPTKVSGKGNKRTKATELVSEDESEESGDEAELKDFIDDSEQKHEVDELKAQMLLAEQKHEKDMQGIQATLATLLAKLG